MFTVTYTDGFGNEKSLLVANKGKTLSLTNQNDISLSLTNIAFMITPHDFKVKGYKNSGYADQAKWVQNSAIEAYKKSKGEVNKFAKYFSEMMKITFVPEPLGESFAETQTISFKEMFTESKQPNHKMLKTFHKSKNSMDYSDIYFDGKEYWINNRDTGDYESLGTKPPKFDPKMYTMPKDMNEGKKDYVIYHPSYTSAVEEMVRFADKNGYTLTDDERWDKIAVGSSRPKNGGTTKLNLELEAKPGTKVTRNKRYLHAQVFDRDTGSNNYELNMYIS